MKLLLSLGRGLPALAAFAFSSALLAGAPAQSRPLIDMETVMSLQLPFSRFASFAGHDVVSTYFSPGQPARVVRWVNGDPQILAEGTQGVVSPDGRWLVFLQGNNWVLQDLQTKEEFRHQLPQAPVVLDTPVVWSKDSRHVAIHFDLRLITPEVRRDLQVVEGVRFEDVERSASLQREANLAQIKPRLLLWDTQVPASPRSLELPAFQAYSGDWIGSLYYYAVGRYGRKGEEAFTAIRTITAAGEPQEEVYRQEGFNQSVQPKASPDGRYLAFASDVDTSVYGVCPSVLVTDLQSKHTIRLTHEGYAYSVQWGGDGGIYYLLRNAALGQLCRVGLDGPPQQLTADLRRRTHLAVSADRQSLLYDLQDGYGTAQLGTWSLAGAKEQCVVTVASPGERYRLGPFQRARWKSSDQLEIQGFLFFPPDFSPAKKYPLFVDVHGGGAGATVYWSSLLGWQSDTPLEWHAWAALGYVVFVPDYRSSGEYGAEVALRRQKTLDWDYQGIRPDCEDVEHGVKWLLAQGYIDPQRVVLFGQSAGGTRANYLLIRSSLFAAAIIHDPGSSGAQQELVNLVAGRGRGASFPWAPDMKTPADWRARTGGFLFEGFLNKTPTLIMVGNPDKGALDPLSTEMLHAMLRSIGTPTRYLKFLDDGHGPASAASTRLRYREMKAWMEQYAPPHGQR